MEIKSDNPEHGFQFPGTFELSAMGTAGTGLETELPRLLESAGVEVLHEVDFAVAKGEIEAFVSSRILEAGLAAVMGEPTVEIGMEVIEDDKGRISATQGS